MVLEVKKQERETNQSLIRRFTKRVQRSGVLVQARKIRFHKSPKSKKMRRKAALRREQVRIEYEKKRKLGISETELQEGSQLTEEEMLEVVSGEAKKRRESIVEFEKGGRNELALKEKSELEVLQKYLPEQMSEEDLKKLVVKAVEKVGAKSPQDMGRVMQELMPQVKGKADGNLVSKIVKELLAQ